MRPIDIVKKVAPKGRAAYLSAFEAGDALFVKHGITTPLRLAHFLAQVLHESGGLTVEFENMNYKAPRMMQIFGVGNHSAGVTESEAAHLAGKPAALAERVYGLRNAKKAKELGNTEPGDGFKYRGGGIMQTTGRGNYRRMGQKCNVDFESDPTLVCTAAHALKPALAEWTEGKLNALADKSDLRAITKRINGGYNGLADREEWFKKVRPLCEGVTFTPKASKPKAPPPAVEPETSVVTVDGAGTTTTEEIKKSAESDVESSPSWLARKWKTLTGWFSGVGLGGVAAFFTDPWIVGLILGFVFVCLVLGIWFMGPGRVRSWIRRQVQ